MAHPAPKPTPEERVGRLRAAFRVLMGRAVTPSQIQAEWIEYKATFNDILSKFGAMLARQAKAESAAVKAALEEDCGCPDGEVLDREAIKADLRRAMNGRSGSDLVEAARARRGS